MHPADGFGERCRRSQPELQPDIVRINRRTIYRWLQAGIPPWGQEALAAKPIPGAPPKLGARKLEKLSRLVRDKTPLQCKFEFTR